MRQAAQQADCIDQNGGSGNDGRSAEQLHLPADSLHPICGRAFAGPDPAAGKNFFGGISAQADFPCCWIQGRKKLIFRQHACIRQQVQQGGFSNIGIPHNLGCGEIPTITVYNKADLLSKDLEQPRNPRAVLISANPGLT